MSDEAVILKRVPDGAAFLERTGLGPWPSNDRMELAAQGWWVAPEQPGVVLAKYDAETLRAMVRKGWAMGPESAPSYPIGDTTDLARAVSAVGRGSGSHNEIRRHIIKNARRLGAMDAIPDNWNADGTMKAALADTLRAWVRYEATRQQEAAAMHEFLDPSGDGLCDICGLPEAAHTQPYAQEIGDKVTEGISSGVEAATADAPTGIPFRIPFLAATNHPTGDGRTMEHFDLAPLPWPFSAQFSLDEGHDGAVPVGKITEATLNESGVVSGLGEYMLTEDGIRAANLAAEGAMPGISINADEAYEMSIGEDGGRVYHSLRLRGATQCQIPAFVEACVEVSPEDVAAGVAAVAARGDVVAAQAEAIVASVAPKAWAPPAAWFDDPHLERVTPLTITDDGRVFGHLAEWGQCHTDYPGECVQPPVSATGYGFFNTGEIVCADGSRRAVGTLTFGAPHAPGHLSPTAAAEHYGNTATAGAYVTAGEDVHGIWLAGAILPDLTNLERAQIMAGSPSGDWRGVGGNLELVAALCVNAPAFPIRREQARLMVASGSCRSLILASVSAPAEVDPLAERVAAQERILASSGLLAQTADALLAGME